LGGLPWVHQNAAILAHSPKMVEAFRSRVGNDVDPRKPEELRKLQYEKTGTDSDQSFERAFIPAHAILDVDNGGHYHYQFLRQAILDAARQGTCFLGVISSFGQEHRTKDEFQDVIEGSLDGILAGEHEAEQLRLRPVRGALLLALRKITSPEKAASLVRQWVDLRQNFIVSHPEFARRMYGIDSIGYESGLRLDTHREAFDLARAHGQWLQGHVGEWWPDDHMEEALLALDHSIEEGFHATINNIALLVDPSTLSDRWFSAERKKALASLQERIVESAIRHHVWLPFSPTSNEVHSQSSRHHQKWNFRRLDPWILKGLRLLVTDDDPGVLETNLPLEFLQLYMGTTAYGPIGFAALKKLLHNSRLFSQQSLRRIDHPLTRVVSLNPVRSRRKNFFPASASA
jgi:hypothetical protein